MGYILRLRLEKLADASGQTTADLDRRPGGLLLFLFLLLLLLLGFVRGRFENRSRRFDSRGFSLRNWLSEGGIRLDDGLGSGGLLRLGISRGGLLSRRGRFLSGRSGCLNSQNAISQL